MLLYKYFDGKIKKIFTEKTIRFSQPESFKDPFELKPVINSIADESFIDNYFAENLKKLINHELKKYQNHLKNKLTDIQLEKLCNELYKSNKPAIMLASQKNASLASNLINRESNNEIGVLCLTETKDNLLMWSHYANSHKGFCICFDSTNHFFNRKRSDKDEFYHLRKVVYVESRPRKSMTEMNGTDLLLLKSDIWKYENEWRMCVPISDFDIKIESIPLPICLYKIPSQAMKQVILGANMHKDDEDEIIDIIKSDNEFKHIQITKAKASPTEFSLEFTDL